MTELVSREPVKVIADIIVHELELEPSQIVLNYEKFDIPPEPGLFVVLSYVSGKAIGNVNESESTPAGMNEIQTVAMQHIIQIDLMSFDNTARTRKEEVIMALRSIYSQQTQEIYNMKIARIPEQFMNASSLEETKILNRFTMDLTIKSVYTKTKKADYYDSFKNVEVVYEH